MTPQEWLVRWMEVKAEYADYPKYFNEEDKQELLALSDELSMRIMLEMLESEISSVNDYIWSGKCPFCIMTRGYLTRDFLLANCGECSYGLRHGVCSETHENDDYSKFKTAIGLNLTTKATTPLDQHLFLAAEVITEFVNSQLTPNPQLE